MTSNAMKRAGLWELRRRLDEERAAQGERLYHLVAVNDATRKTERLTAYPMTHEQCVENKSRFNPAPHVRIVLVAA